MVQRPIDSTCFLGLGMRIVLHVFVFTRNYRFNIYLRNVTSNPVLLETYKAYTVLHISKLHSLLLEGASGNVSERFHFHCELA